MIYFDIDSPNINLLGVLVKKTLLQSERKSLSIIFADKYITRNPKKIHKRIK